MMRFKNILIAIFLMNIVIKSYGQKAMTVLRGTSNDSLIQYVSINTYSPFWDEFTPDVLASARKVKDSAFILRFKLSEPLQVSFMILNKTWPIYIIPGSSMTFSIHRDSLNIMHIYFHGEDAQYSNYIPRLEEYMRSYPVKQDYKNMYKYKESVNTWYDNEINFLDQYEKHYQLSDKFVIYEMNEIQYRYTNLLYYPIRVGAANRVNLPTNYFKNPDNFSIINNSIHFSDNSKLAFVYKYILCYTNNPWKDFNSTYLNALYNFHGKTRDFLIANLIGVYTSHPTQINKNILNKAINEARIYVRDSECLSYISRCEQRYNFLVSLRANASFSVT